VLSVAVGGMPTWRFASGLVGSPDGGWLSDGSDVEGAATGLVAPAVGDGAGSVVAWLGSGVEEALDAAGEPVAGDTGRLPGVTWLGAAATTGPRCPAVSGSNPYDPAATTATRATASSARVAGRRIEPGIRRTVVRTIPRGLRRYHHRVTPVPASPGAAQLLRSVGLLVDGPGQWGRPVSAPGPGVFAIELAAPLATVPIELTRVGKWIERVETLRLDGARPTSKALAARLASFWLPSQTVLYVGSTDVSIGRRLAAIARTELGDRRPAAGGHWLMTLRGLDGLRIWWSPTDATEEYEDAVLEAFAEGVSTAERAALPDREVILPFANLRRADGPRKTTGLTASLLAEPVAVPLPPTRIVQLPDADVEGARGGPPDPRRRVSSSGSAGRRAATAPASVAAPAAGGAAGAEAVGRSDSPIAGDAALTAEGAERLQAELANLVRVRRPEVIARIRTAKEHGDLKENAEYHAAREEQSFLEGRVQALEARLRTAVVVDAPASGARVGFGSRVTVEADGETVSYTIVGASDSDPAAGRISSASPVGRALVGHDVGELIVVRTPAGERHYRIIEVG